MDNNSLLHSIGGTLLAQTALILALHENKTLSREAVATQLEVFILYAQDEALPPETIHYLQALRSSIEETGNTPGSGRSVSRKRPDWLTVLSGGKATD